MEPKELTCRKSYPIPKPNLCKRALSENLPKGLSPRRGPNVLNVIKKKKTRRSKYKNKKISNNVHTSNSYFTVIGSNCHSLLGKKDSLLSSIQLFKPMVYMLQESRLPRKGMIRIPQYQVFETLRTSSEGGGLFTAIHKN